MGDTELLLVLTSVLFAIGLFCLVTRKNMIQLLLGIAIISNAANMNFVLFSASFSRATALLAYSTVLILIVLEACILAVGLAIIICAFRHYQTLDVTLLKKLRW